MVGRRSKRRWSHPTLKNVMALHCLRGPLARPQIEIDPNGEIVVRSRRHVEDFLFADIDTTITDRDWNVGRSMWSARKFGQQLLKISRPRRYGLATAPPKDSIQLS